MKSRQRESLQAHMLNKETKRADKGPKGCRIKRGRKPQKAISSFWWHELREPHINLQRDVSKVLCHNWLLCNRDGIRVAG
ncbi:unnamed protein product [Sphenostylis stenocarpa]|uniref:Uncharacterized protein n=1 Tax=Sphenostylis stenocarpa TaxID=92480 RepID=A0AA86VPG4_9FABA|nr:unnamed protein product [Sphenostylis stenocarpa]